MIKSDYKVNSQVKPHLLNSGRGDIQKQRVSVLDYT